MTIKIPGYISTKTYYTNSKPLALSFIINLKDFAEFVLKDEMAMLWDFIVKNKDYDLIRKYAVNNHQESIIDDFLSQLKENNLIDTKQSFVKYKSNYLPYRIKFDSENINYFIYSRNNFLKKNSFFEKLNLILNYTCNLHCKHCCNPKNIDKYQISFENAKCIIDEAVDIGVFFFKLTGGECTLNKDFLKIARYIKNKHANLIINTNGQKLYDDENFFNELIKLYPYNIQLSLYSMDPDIHDNMTGVKGSHHKTLTVIKKLHQNNIIVSIANFLSSFNKNSSKDLIKFSEELGIDYKESCRFFNNTDNNNSNASLSEIDIENYYLNNIDFSVKYKNFEKNNEYLCGAGVTTLSVEPNLDITPCTYNKYVFGNYKKTSLKKLKEKILPEYSKKFTADNLTECFKYDYCKYCYYCAKIAADDNSFMKKSEQLCKHAKILNRVFLKQKQLQKN